MCVCGVWVCVEGGCEWCGVGVCESVVWWWVWECVWWCVCGGVCGCVCVRGVVWVGECGVWVWWVFGGVWVCVCVWCVGV